MPEIATRAAELLLAARRDPARRLDDLPPELRPADRAVAYAIQQQVAAQLGPIGGWKVGPVQADGLPLCGALPASGILAGPVTIGPEYRLRGVEAEVAVRIGHDLPPRATPYSPEEVAAAIAAFHPAIEVLESRFVEPASVPMLTALADFQSHGAFVFGPGVTEWRGIDLAAESVEQRVDGAVNATRTGHPGGDLLGQVIWLANAGSVWAGGLKAGQFVTCGSWTGANRVAAGAQVSVRFSSVGEVSLRFAP
ncbi:2-keto-4-pentenoate hydratase [Rhodovastum atsumiense]|nr:fumarylacetoacetate hydrolase family protein [Rhodovastum atsumiense]CAH2601201.1 2-keto-4-pentenoate hydratase [Rhodovastum atsumiense]